MPKTKRDILKLRHDQIMNHIESAVTFTADLHDQFRPVHPEYADGYAVIIEILTQAHEFVENMKSFL